MTLTNGNGNGERFKALADNAYLRLFSYIASSIAAPAIVYLLLTSNGQGNRLTAVEGSIVAIRTELGLRTVSRYTSEDAKRDMASVDTRFRDIERRLDRLEK